MLKEQEAGLPTSELCRKHGLSQARLPNPKPTSINPKDSRYDRRTTGGQVRAESYLWSTAKGGLVFLRGVWR